MLKSAMFTAAVALGAAAVALSSTACDSRDPATGGQGHAGQPGSGQALDGAESGWRASATFGVPRASTTISSISAPSGADGWAAGVTESPGPHGPKMSALVEHWAGRKWQRVGMPAHATAEWNKALLNSILAASVSDGLWAFDTARKGDEYTHFNGKQWTFGTLPDTGADKTAHRLAVLIGAAAAVSQREVWAFGMTLSTSGSGTPYAAEYNGHSWVTQHVPGSGAIVAVAVLSPRDVLALVGTDEYFGFGPTTPTIVRWNGRTWRPLPVQPGRLPADAQATSMAVSDGHIWIAGNYATQMVVQGDFAAELQGSSWKVTDLPESASSDSFDVTSLAPDGRGGLWGLGFSFTDAAQASQRLWHYTGGRWLKPTEPTFGGSVGSLQQLAAVPGTDMVWGAGGVRHKSALDGLIAVEGPTPR